MDLPGQIISRLARHLGGEFEFREGFDLVALADGRQREDDLQAGESLADTGVSARAERDVPVSRFTGASVLPPRWPKRERIFPEALVLVDPVNREVNVRARWEPVAAEFDLPGRRPGDRVDRRMAALGFVHDPFGQLQVLNVLPGRRLAIQHLL